MQRGLLLLLTMVAISWHIAFAQKAKIVNEAVSPEKLIEMELTSTINSVSSGLNVVANGTYVYLSAKDIGKNESVTSVDWSFVSKPSGSNASFETVPDHSIWTAFKTDTKGAYEVKLSMSTASGSHDTTLTIYSADFIGNPAFDGVTPQGINCMSCHSGSDKFTEAYTKWQSSGHATIFKTQITSGSAYYSTNCMKCHTVGYDHNVSASNNGFDDKATSLEWKWQGPPNSGKWDTLKTQFPGLVAYAQIGCENCHGPASEHAFGSGSKKETIEVSPAAGSCAQCHDEPWRHNKVSEYENSLHSEAIWSNSFTHSSGDNSISGDCARCHEAQAFINFTKGGNFDAENLNSADHIGITCATCHDPHGNDNIASLREIPAGSDTLGNGYAYSEGGEGQLCMSCHKARRDNVAYTQSKVTSAHWGPHGSTQTDVFLGKNAAEFGAAYNTSNIHTTLLQNACIDCHMQATTDTGTVTRDRVGGHSWHMSDKENNYDHTVQCQSCHSGKNKFSDFTAKSDYDGDGNSESIQDEIKGLLTNLSIALPPAGIDSISYKDIGAINDVNINKAYWNYQMILKDGSFGMHNTQFAVAVLQASLATITGVEQVNDITPKSYSLSQNFPNPFNPSTSIRFSLPETADMKLTIYDAIGNEVAVLHNGTLEAGTYNVNWNASNMSSGIYFYKISSDKFNMTKKMVLIK